MAHEILMPKLGLTMTEGTIEEWKVKEGTAVKKGDVLYSVATDKLTNDVEALFDGILLKVVVAEGETVPCKAVVGYLGEAGEAIPGATAEGSPASDPAPSSPPVAVVKPAAVRAPGEPILASPAAKKLAKEKGVDLALVAGTGPKGRITVEDVEGYLNSAAEAPQEEEPEPKMSPTAAKVAADLGVNPASLNVEGRIMKADVLAAAGQVPVAETVPAVEDSNDYPAEKVNPLRRSIASNMVMSWHTSPRVTLTRPVDCTELKNLRKRLNNELKEKGIKVSYNHILMKATSKVLMEFPNVNASFSDNMLTRHKHVNMGLAVAKGDGLIVPNVKRCDTKSISEIAKETEELIQNTRAGKITLENMTGGTFTITNVGVYGITNFSPIINQPELAILGVCDMVDTPVVRDGQVVIRPMMNLCLTIDHRVIDGVMGSTFLKRVCDLLEDPYLLLA